MKTLDARGSRQFGLILFGVRWWSTQQLLARARMSNNEATNEEAKQRLHGFNLRAFRQFKNSNIHCFRLWITYTWKKTKKNRNWRENDCGLWKQRPQLDEEVVRLYSHHNYKYINWVELATRSIEEHKRKKNTTKNLLRKLLSACMRVVSGERWALNMHRVGDATNTFSKCKRNDDTDHPRSFHQRMVRRVDVERERKRKKLSFVPSFDVITQEILLMSFRSSLIGVLNNNHSRRLVNFKVEYV